MASTTDEARRTDRAMGTGRPQKGDRVRCRTCGMELQITADCRCEEPNHVHFRCCGGELDKV